MEKNIMQEVKKDIFLKSPLKWAGGKAKLMDKIEEVYSKDFFWYGEKYTYIELFGGGGSSWLFVLQYYHPMRMIVNDINPNVINFWRCVQSDPKALCEVMDSIISNYLSFDWEDRKEFFLNLRKTFNANKDYLTGTNIDIRMAAMFLFLNKTCFNGLWRTNSKGEFNTPFGKPTNLNRDPNIYNKDNILMLSKLIKGVEFTCRDYKDVIGDDVAGDVLVYMDPPYRGTWTGYSQNGFDESDQEELAWFCKSMIDENCYVIESNSMCHNNFFEKNYPDFHIKVVNNVSRNVRPTAERKVQEILMYNLTA